MDWYPWGAEAFEAARKADKPIFLSIGYSTCHWCHVMEEESFENPSVASVINSGFIPIKVDREERPDIDKIYMGYVVASTGSGGWPMTVILTPDRKPFYGGTYFPPEDRWGRPGIVRVLNYLSEVWQKERARVLEAADDALTHLQPEAAAPVAGGPGTETLFRAYEQFSSGFDAARGGFGGAPKFPSAHGLSFLLKYHVRSGDAHALEMALKTLEEMSRGGMYDQIGGGFHRYSVDAGWRVPHFEKMLYDQAMLARSYAEAYALTHRGLFAATAREICDYVLRDLTSPAGGFYSAEDADSPEPSDPSRKREGAFYVWGKDEAALAAGAGAALLEHRFGILPGGNAPDDPHGEFTAKNILYQAHTLEETAQHAGVSPQDAAAALERAKKALFDLRAKRPRPHLDDKVLADWNGLMIGALAVVSRATGEPRYAKAAARAADFVLTHMRDKDGALLHRWRDGEAAVAGQLDDYAFMAWGMLELYQATFDERLLTEARALADEMLSRFPDKKNGGFFMTDAAGDGFLITRPKESYDGAIPSGNSAAVLVLIMLEKMTGDLRYGRAVRDMFGAFSGVLSASPTSHAQMLTALDFALGPSTEAVIAGDAGDPAAQALLREAVSHVAAPGVVLFHKTGEAGAALRHIAPFVADKGPVGGRAAAYLCRDRTSDFPVTDTGRMHAELTPKKPGQAHAPRKGDL